MVNDDYDLLRNHRSISGPHGDAALLQTDECLFFINKYKGIRTFEIMNKFAFISEYVMNLEWFFFLLNKYVFIELLYELYVLQLTLIGNVHHGLTSVHIYYCHWNRVVYRVEQQQHHTVAYFKFCQILMSKYIEHLVSFE